MKVSLTRNRLLTLIFLVFLCLSIYVITTFFSIRESKLLGTQEILKQKLLAQEYAGTLSVGGAAFIASTAAELESISMSPELNERNPSGCDQVLKNNLNKANRYGGKYLNIMLVDPKGIVLCDALSHSEPFSVAKNKAFRINENPEPLTSESTLLSGFKMGDFPGRSSIEFLHTFNRDNHDNSFTPLTIYALRDVSELSSIAQDAFQNNRIEFKLDSTAIAYLVNVDGIILGRYPDPEHWIGKSLPESALFDSYLKSPRSASTTIHNGFDGIDRVTTFSSIGNKRDAGIFVVVSIPLDKKSD